jgi:hypothetical protein
VALIKTDVSEDRIASYEFVPIQELITSLCNQLAFVSLLRVCAYTRAYNFAL